ASEADIAMSVCTGAFALADLGLLDGRQATTHWSALQGLKNRYPKITVRDDLRVVDNGQIVTTAGVSAGIDGALHVIARLCGPETAKQTAKAMEYRLDENLSAEFASASKKSLQAEARDFWFAGKWKEAAKAYQ